MRPIEIKRIRSAGDDSTSHDKVYLRVIFKDTYRFFPGSLEAYAANLLPEQFKNIEKFLSPKHDSKLVDMLKRKGVFPYEYIDSFERYNETSLPEIHEFSTSDGTTRRHITPEDHQYAKDVFRFGKCKDIGAFNDLYLETDTLITADVFENYRNIAINPDTYGLDPAHYYTLPGFSWDAMLKFTDVKLELLSDLKMVNFFNKGMRGGVSQCSHRYAEANNPYMDTYKPTEESSYLMYLDVNNLYGWAMCHPLPVDEFQWMPDEEVAEMTVDSIESLPVDGYHGYIFEVDLEYPAALHNQHNDLPFCPVKKKINGVEKLCLTLEPKTHYITHYRNLKLAIKNGLVLTKIYKGLKFHQSTWLAPYIRFNNDLRTKAKTPAEKDTFKLSNNSIFGKSVENVKKRRNIYLCQSWSSDGQKRGAENYIASGYCKKVKVFNDSLIAVELAQKSINFNKPIYVGFTVLELSKIRMYDFHYNMMRHVYPQPGQLQLCYMDTDSFIYHIKTNDYYEDMKTLIHQKYAREDDIRTFDTSNYQIDNPYGYAQLNKKVLGAMKDEAGGLPMTLFIGLRAKAYYYEIEGQDGTRKAKGIKRRVADTLMKDDYMHCLKEPEAKIRKTMVVFRSDHHKIYSERVRKVALNGADDKRIIYHDGISTFAYGHTDVQLFELESEFINDNNIEMLEN